MNSGPHRRAAFAGSAAAALMALAAPVAVHAQEAAYSFSIPSQDLGAALRAYARTAHQQVVFDSATLRGRHSPSLVGSYTAGEGLRRLLAGSDLSVRRTPSGVIYVEAAGPQLQGAPSEPEQATAVEELVVTADKRSEGIQKVPGSVSAIGGGKLESLGLKSLADLSQYAVGLNVGDGGSPGQTTVTLRGVAPVGPGSVVGYYIDDTPLGSSGNFASATGLALDLMPYDLERFEVLRGPQGTLYGAGAMGGLLKYVLKQADTDTFSARAGAELTSVENSGGLGYGLRGSVNLPLVTDKLGVRASFYDQLALGYTDNIRLDQKGTDDVRQEGARLAVTWKPADTVRVNLNALWSRIDSKDNAWVTLGDVTSRVEDGVLVFDGKPTLGSLTHSTAYAQPFKRDLTYLSGTVNWDVGALKFVSATSWSRTHTFALGDSTANYGAYTQLFGLPPGVSKFTQDLHLDKFTQEFRLQSPTGGRVEWLVGGFFTDERSTNDQLVMVFDQNYQPITGPFAAYFDPYFALAQLPTTYREYAAFGDLTLNLTDKFDVTGGLRYASNHQKFRQISDGLVLGGRTDQPGSSEESVTTWSVNARYRFTDQTMAYAKVATGYRPGGPNVVLPGVKPTVDSDTLTSYEAGLKTSALGGRAKLNLSVFDIEWKGIQLSVQTPDNTATFTANAGDAYSRGVELEGAYSPVSGLRIGFNAAYTKARLTSLIAGAPPFLIGYQLPGVPEWSGTLTADYSWPVFRDWQASVGGGVHYVGEEWVTAPAQPGYTPNTRQPSYATADARIGLSNDRWAVNLYVRNLTDNRAYLLRSPVQDPFSGTTYAINTAPLQPRLIGLSVDARF